MIYNKTFQQLEDFYNSLNESQKFKVEEKLRLLLKEGYSTVALNKTNPMRYQIASDMFQILKG